MGARGGLTYRAKGLKVNCTLSLRADTVETRVGPECAVQKTCPASGQFCGSTERGCVLKHV